MILLQIFLSNCNILAAQENLVEKFKLAFIDAKKGSPKAMFLLARMLERGTGTKKNIKEASKWYQRSASQNYPAANARLGKLYLEGIGVKRNLKKSFELLQLASVQGIPSAQFNLAIIYELGVGTTKDIEQAIKWFDRAVQGGYYTAKNKSDILKQKLGINIKSNVQKQKNTIATIPKNSTLQGIGNIDKPSPIIKTKKIPKRDKIVIKELSNETKKDQVISQNLNNKTKTRDEFKFNTLPISINQLSKKQKLDLIRNKPLRQTLTNILEGRWFDKNKPANLLPSPKTQCNIINRADIKCSSRQLQRQTSNETIYYKTTAIISQLTSGGKFILKYQNTILRILIDKKLTAQGKPFVSKLKKGAQKKIYTLNCQYNKTNNVNCNNEKADTLMFTNRANTISFDN